MDNVFHKGFLPTKNKKCVKPYKDKSADELMTYEQVKDLPEFAGILSEDAVLIDIDDMEQSEIMMQIVEEKELLCRVYSSRKGMHFLFKNNGSFKKCRTKTKIACGLCVDIKVGCTNSYEVLKIDGKERELLYDILEDETYQAAPAFLNEIRSGADFFQMSEGDGRDSALYGYILNLQSIGLDKDEAIECIHIINDHLLKDKMSADDIERITRDEAFLKPVFFNKGTFLFDSFAMYMRSEHHIKRINGQLHMFKDGIYVSGYNHIEAAMIQHIPTLNRARRKEVLEYLELLTIEETPATDAKWIAFRNGLLNIQDDTFKDFTPDVVVTNIIPWDYNPHAYDELTDKTLNKVSCNDKAIRALLEEMAGACMFRSNDLAGGKAFILTGSGSNGKSTYLNMIKTMLGRDNVSSLDIKKFDDRFSTIMLYGKLANIGDDISSDYIADSAIIKKVITGETISAEQKGQPKFDFEPKCKVIVSSNNIPRIGSGQDSFAIIRRFVIIPFNALFSKDDEEHDAFIGEKLKSQEAIEYLIKLGVAGLKRVLESGEYTSSDELIDKLKQYEEKTNPVLGFVAETSIDEILYHTPSEVYIKFTIYCDEQGVKPYAKSEFRAAIQEKLHLDTSPRKIAGKSVRVYVKA